MSTENSSLVFGVRTEDAVQGLDRLHKKLNETLDAFDRLQQQGKASAQFGPGAEALGRMRTLAAEAEVLGEGLGGAGKTAEELDKAFTRTTVSMRRKIGEASVAIKANLNTTAAEIEAVNARINKAVGDSSSALGAANIQRIAEETNRRRLAAERAADKAWVEQRKLALGSLTALESSARRKQLADMREDFIRRSEAERQFSQWQIEQRRNALNQITALESSARRKQLAEMRASATAAFSVAPGGADTTRDLDKNTRGIRNNTTAMREAHNAARGLAGSLGLLWMTWGSLTPLVTGAGIGSIARQTFTVGKDVEYRLKMLEALGNAPTSVDAMMPSVHGSMKTPLEAAQGLQELAQAGLSTNEALAALTTTLRLATLGEMSVADAALTTTSALSTFNLEVHEATRIGDVFAKAASVSNTTVAGIAEAMKQAGSAAAIYGLTVEETAAQIAVLAQHGIRGTAAGTAIKNSMTELYAPTKKAAEAMKSIGLEIYNQDGSSRNYLDILKDLKQSYVGLDDAGRNMLLRGMFNERSRRAIQIFMMGMSELETTSESLGDSFGFLAKANDDLLNTVEGASNRMQSVLQQTLVRSFDRLRPEIRSVIGELEGLFASSGFQTAVEGIGRTFTNLAGILTRNSGTILALVGAYTAYRLALMASNGVLQGYAALVDRATAAKAAQTAALAANTGAQVANNAANTAGAVAQAGFASRLGSAVGLLARLTPGLNAVTIGLTVGATAWSAYKAMTDNATSPQAADTAVSNLNKITQAIREQTRAMDEALKLRDLAAGGNNWTLAGQRKDVQEQYETHRLAAKSLEQQVENAKRARDLAREEGRPRDAKMWARAAGELEENLKTVQASAREMGIAVNEANRAETEYRKGQERSKAAADLDQARSRLSGIVGDYGYMSKEDQDKFNPLYQQAKAILDGLKETEAVTGDIMSVIGNVERRYSELRAKYAGAGGGGGGGDSLIYRSSSANIMQELNNQRTILKSEMDFRLGLIKTEQKEGVLTTKQASEQRISAWKDYTDQYTKLAQDAAQRISGLEKGSPELKNLTRQKIEEQVAQQKRLADQAEDLAQRRERLQSESDARILVMGNKRAMDTVARQVAEEERDRRNAAMRQSMFQHEIEMLDARNKVEEHYTKVLERQYDALTKGRLANPEFDSTDAGRNLLKAIGNNELARTNAGNEASQRALKDFDTNRGILAGYDRALVELGNQALEVGNTVQNALTTSFNAVGTAVGTVVNTGRLNLRSFLADLSSQLAQMFANQMVAQFLFAFLPRFGASPATIGAGQPMFSSIGASFRFAQGGAFSGGSLTRFAQGGAFTNTVTRGTNIAPMAMFGEAGPEAIMPLARTPSGDLGVRALPYGADPSGGSSSGGNIYIDTTVILDGNGNATASTTTSGQSDRVGTELAGMIADQTKAVIQREMKFGGLIDVFVKGRR